MSERKLPELGETRVLWDFMSNNLPFLELGRKAYVEKGWGDLAMDIVGNPKESDSVSVIYIRNGIGKPSMYAEWLGAQAYYLTTNDGVLPDDEKMMATLLNFAEQLESDLELQAVVMSRDE